MSVHSGGRGPGHMSRKAAGGFSPASLFPAAGVWYDPSDLSTLFQDTAGSTPVTAVGQSVARINDKSGGGNHAIQGTAGLLPILRQDAGGRYYLEFDGADDFLVTGSINFTATDEMTVIAGVRRIGSTSGIIVESSASAGLNAGTFMLQSSAATGVTVRFQTGGSASVVHDVTTTDVPVTQVITAQAKIATDTSIIRINGAQAGSISTDMGTGNYTTQPLYIGARGGTSRRLNGHLYGLIVRGKASTAAELAAAEAWMNGKTGAY